MVRPTTENTDHMDHEPHSRGDGVLRRRIEKLPHLRPGDQVVRVHRSSRFHLRRVLGIPGLYSVGYGDVGSSIFYALGLVAVAALGATPVALFVAGIFFVFTALTYAEGTAMFPEAGGSASFARRAFNDLIAFWAGWSLMFGYIITISISILTVPHYLGYFWPVLKEPSTATFFAVGVIAFLMVINVLGVRESSGFNFTLTVFVLLIQALLIVTGVGLFFKAGEIWQRITRNWPDLGNLVFGVAIATVAYTGIESVSQLAGEAREPQKRVPRALLLMIVTVLVVFAGVSITAFSVMNPTDLAGKWSEDALAGVANGVYLGIDPNSFADQHSSDPASHAVIAFFVNLFRSVFPPAVAVMGAAILTVAGNAGLLGISRITFSLAENHSLPPVFGRVHSRFKTPYVAIIVFAGVAIAVLVQGLFLPNMFTILGGLYAFGSMLTFALAHASILMLRVKSPDRPRPFKLGLNIPIMGRRMPITAILGLVASMTVWVVVIVMQPYSRWFGLSWMAIGLMIYMLYRKVKGMPLTGGGSGKEPGEPDQEEKTSPGVAPRFGEEMTK
ncbi:MAG: APC family permease [Chloroflexi bacterium]|nr:APC family permease [Chloroflexota bacterium]